MFLEVLKNCRVEGNIIKLPPEQLDRKVYNEVKNRLELIGGKWKGGKTYGFVFEVDPTDLLTDLQNGDTRNLKQEYQFFPTPVDIAAQMVSYLPPVTADAKVLEPSAGDGALIKAFSNVYPLIKVDCYELMDLNKTRLYKYCNSDNADLKGSDFLIECTVKNYYDIILANPPFTKNQDIDHIRKMYECLKPGGTLITLASTSWTFGSQKKQVEFKEWLEAMDVFPLTLPAKSFASSGTMIAPVLLQIKKPVTDDIDKTTNSEEPVPVKSTKQKKNKISSAIDQAEMSSNEIDQLISDKPVRTCRECGCTDKDCRQCIKKTGKPCHWVEDDLCSACVIREPDEILKDIIQSQKDADVHLKQLQNLLNPNDMNFFQQLYEKIDGIDVTLKIKRQAGKLTISVLPEAIANIKQVILNGTPEEVDAGFFQAIEQPIGTVKGLITELQHFNKSVENAKKEAKEESTKPLATTSKTSDKKPEPKKAQAAKEKKATPKAKPVIEEPNLFA